MLPPPAPAAPSRAVLRVLADDVHDRWSGR
jgi:hypothetical protein